MSNRYEYTCPYCGKEFKTEKGITNHLEKCEKKNRYEILQIYPDLYANLYTICNYLYGNKFVMCGDCKKWMANDKYFKQVKDFTDYCIKSEVYSHQDFIMYLLANKVPFNKWKNESNLINFLYDWLYYEDEENAIKRSKKWLNDRDLSLETISPNRLFLALKYGNISVKYLKSMNYNWENNVDCESEEKTNLKYFLRG